MAMKHGRPDYVFYEFHPMSQALVQIKFKSEKPRHPDILSRC